MRGSRQEGPIIYHYEAAPWRSNVSQYCILYAGIALALAGTDQTCWSTGRALDVSYISPMAGNSGSRSGRGAGPGLNCTWCRCLPCLAATALSCWRIPVKRDGLLAVIIVKPIGHNAR